VKVGLLTENYYPTLGGVQEHVYNLAVALRQRGVDARVITGLPQVDRWRGPQDEPWVHRVAVARRWGVMGTSTAMTIGWSAARNLRRLLREERFDLVHVHGPCNSGLPFLYRLLGREPCVATLHSPMNGNAFARRLVAPYYKWCVRGYRKIIAVSDAASLALQRYATFDPVLIPNGVDVRQMASGTPMMPYRDGRLNVLMLGRLEPRNGPDIMFAAMPEIVRQHPDVRLLVVGEENPSGTARHQAMVPESIRANVVFLGSMFETRPDAYATAHLCVLPARAGTFSIIMLEALAAGCPIAATPFIARCHEESHWKTAYISDAIEVESWKRTVLTAIAEVKSGQAAARVAMGRELVQRFDWPNLTDDVMKVYRAAID
jgi:phosphatidyl-myo-inositol alpha-mannosyltransferase